MAQLLPETGGAETVVSVSDGGPVDGHWAPVWERLGADPSDPFAE